MSRSKIKGCDVKIREKIKRIDHCRARQASFSEKKQWVIV